MAIQSIASLGEIMQIAFVPQDFDGMIAHWVKLGAGPFYVIRDNQADWQTAYGVDCRPVLDIALGQWGEMQIEVIRQKSAEKTIYSDWFNACREGVHHTCIVVDDIDEFKRRCEVEGMAIVIEGRANGTRWLYADTGGGPGTYLEALEAPRGTPGLNDMLKAAHRDWDGRNPVRELAI